MSRNFKLKTLKKETWLFFITLSKTRCSLSCLEIAAARTEKPINIWRNMSSRTPRGRDTLEENKENKVVTKRFDEELSSVRISDVSPCNGHFEQWDFSSHNFWASTSARTARPKTEHRMLYSPFPPPLNFVLVTRDARRRRHMYRTQNVCRMFGGCEENESTASTWTVEMISKILLWEPGTLQMKYWHASNSGSVYAIYMMLLTHKHLNQTHTYYKVI